MSLQDASLQDASLSLSLRDATLPLPLSWGKRIKSVGLTDTFPSQAQKAAKHSRNPALLIVIDTSLCSVRYLGEAILSV